MSGELRDRGEAALVLAATTAAAIGWAWADDKPQASAGLSLLFGLVVTAMLKGRASRLLGLACTYAIGYQASSLACVVWYARLASRDVGVCDEGTGQPVGLLYCMGALMVAAELLARRNRS